jgi:ADP-heptose:LPS heptosyltransferase
MDIDVSIVPCTVSFSLTSAIISWLSGARVKIGGETEDIFYRNGEMFFNVYLKVRSRGRHQADVNLEYAKPLGIKSVKDKTLSLAVSKTDDEWALAWIKENGITSKDYVVMIHPGAGKPGNRWPAGNFAELCNYLAANYRIKLIIAYGPKETGLRDALVYDLKCRYVLLEPVPLFKFAAILRHSSLFVCNDTGVLHMAAGIGKKTFAVFGLADPEFWNPLGKLHHAVWDPGGDIAKITARAAINELNRQKAMPDALRKK